LSALAVGAPTASLLWQIGRPVRYYEVFLPNPAVPAVTLAPNLDTSALLKPDLAQPVAYGTVGVSSVDWRNEVDDQYWPSRGRKGNESYLSGPATVFRVLRDPPPVPSYNWNVTRLYATKANYQAKSFFTLRWNKPATGPYFAHVLRAMDHSLFLAHWSLTAPISTPTSGAPPAIPAFLTSFDAHKTNNEYAAASALYDQLDDASLWWLAALPELADAYTQVTIDLLALSDPGNRDRLGPDDDPATFAGPNPATCAYMDTLDGRSTNRYFYRAMLLDGAQNRGAMGAPTPPVYLPKVVPPRAPVITKVLGGERQIALTWAANREPDLAEYRIYRADDAGKAADVRLMILVATIPEPQPNPALRAKDVSWTDAALPAGTDFHYRITALDSEVSPNESAPSKAVSGRAIQMAPPVAPQWVSAEWVIYDPGTSTMQPWPQSSVVPAPYQAAIRLALTSSDDFCTIYRRVDGDKPWQAVAVSVTPSAGQIALFDLGATVGKKMDYRAVASNDFAATSPYSTTFVVEPK
jgi:hypothetical protein